ncbi:hypothetical protein [Paracoccus sp. pheM1]|uniref:hypothetical protein n=1 Tax=Paracoccus sp. pheM1 TaxID=2831675 RepID=UPI001BDB822B|nr:hypothetical protein [Paracoccus sp. pheM1]MBT0779257.1 hypothetical protein [Paracoccus sp. pheM1]
MFVLILYIALPLPSLAQEEVKVSVVRADKPGTAVASRIDIYRGGTKIAEPDYRIVGDTAHHFMIEACNEDITFKVALISRQYEYEDKFYPCDTPEVQIPARMYTYIAFLDRKYDGQAWWTQDPVDPLDGGMTADIGGIQVVYADQIEVALAAPESVFSALGELGENNQLALLDALDRGDFGAASFYANENAALALQAGDTLLSTRYGLLSYDAGFRSMGVDPLVAELPLVANDAARDIYVMTPEGEQLMQQYHLQMGRPAPTTWNNTTTRYLMMHSATDSKQDGLKQLRSTEELRAFQINELLDRM